MKNTKEGLRRVKAGGVGYPFAKNLQRLALEGWTEAYKDTRDPEVIKRAFDPDNSDMVAEALKRYKFIARHGRLIVASEHSYGQVVAFGLAINDVSPTGPDFRSLAQRTGKRTLALVHNQFGIQSPQRLRSIYAKVQHVVVKPGAAEGIGTALVKASLVGRRPEQISTAYIDDENERSKAFFLGLGYSWDGNPSVDVYRFGEDNEPTEQLRFTAPVQTVLDAATAKLAELAA